MTREEAVSYLEFEREQVLNKSDGIPNDLTEAYGMAIEALQEPEIVHCKDCVYWKAARIGICGLAGYFIGERGYCLYGKAGEQE